MTNFIGPSAVHVPIPIYGEPVTDTEGHEYRPVTGYVEGYHVNIAVTDQKAFDKRLVKAEEKARKYLDDFDKRPDSDFKEKPLVGKRKTRTDLRKAVKKQHDDAVKDLEKNLAKHKAKPEPVTPFNTWAGDSPVMVGGEIDENGEVVGGELQWRETAFMVFADEAEAREALGNAGLIATEEQKG